jgi:hypothetical protein
MHNDEAMDMLTKILNDQFGGDEDVLWLISRRILNAVVIPYSRDKEDQYIQLMNVKRDPRV